MGPIVRDAVAGDLPQLVAVYNHYVINTPVTFDVAPVSIEQRATWLQQFSTSGRHRLLVCEHAGIIQGYAGSHTFRAKPAYEPTVELTVYCAPDALGQGIGTRLYRALFAALQGEDIHAYVAGVTLPNDASLALHRRFGFQPVGVFHAVGRKFNRFWDVSWWERVGDLQPS